MRFRLSAVGLTLLVGCTAGAQDKKTSITPECAKTIRVKDSTPIAPYKILPDESYKRPPTLKFLIQENGTVSDVKVTHSSGVADIDKKAADSVARWKFKPRPNGCGVIENEATVVIHWDSDSD